jgi:7,8-dihydropterin-6-yl-methyl-4-(beta-D-ribofuranosyl)aminobenzene 5'-phosphate synthase
LGARFLLTNTPAEIDEDLLLSGEVPRQSFFEAGDREGRFCHRNGVVVPDRLLDDQSLIIRTSRGLLIVLGCAHSGVINVIDHAVRLTGIDRIFGVVGGTHLGFSDEGQIQRATEKLKGYGIEHLVPSHCTGMPVAMKLRAELPGAFELSYVGKVLEF